MSSNIGLPAVLGGQPVTERALVSWPVVGDADVAAVAAVVRDGLFANEDDGAVLPVEQFERRFAQVHNTEFAIAVTNGTHTLQLLLEAVGIGLGDAVFVPGLTWQATAAAVADVNALPWLVDIGVRDWGMDAEKLEDAILEAKKAGYRPRAVFGVHLYNRMAHIDSIALVCNRHGLIVFEDCAHAHGAIWRRSVTIPTLARSFSFQRSKANTIGEGGVITTDDPVLAAALRSLRNCGRPELAPAADLPDWATGWVVRSEPGDPDGTVRLSIQSGNFRMTELQAALGLVQLERFVADQQPRRREIMAALDEIVLNARGVSLASRQPSVVEYPQYKWAFIWDAYGWDGLPAAAARRILEAEFGLEVTAPYEPLTHSPYYRPHHKPARHRLNDQYWELLDPTRYDLPNVEHAYETGICIEHRFPLDPTAPEQLTKALAKMRAHLPELITWWAGLNG